LIAEIQPLTNTTATDSSDADHARMRKLLAHAFSETALREQEELLNEYFELLLHQLKRQIDSPSQGIVDMDKWIKFLTYDVVADLALGESFDALQSGKYHPWMDSFFTSFKMLRFAQLGAEYPIFGVFLKIMSKNPRVAKMRNMIFGFTQGKTERRLDSPTQRKDFISYVSISNSFEKN
jgi:cytochrome P450